MDRPLRFRDLRGILRRFGIEEVAGRGKGSERWFRNQAGEGFPITCHGEGRDVGVGLIKAARRKFKLTSADGVSDRDFYGA